MIQHLSGNQPTKGLYIVSTPIGHLSDITLRALAILSQVDLIACEDTRVSRKLLDYYGIKSPLVSYHDHNADEMRPQLIAKMEQGTRIALISDAGTPLISDPGYKLVRDCYEHKISVTPIPGASAVLSAVVKSGLPCQPFLFEGFLSSKQSARRETLEKYKKMVDIMGSFAAVFYESAQRLDDTLQDIHDVLGDIRLSVMRELTKKFEDIQQGTPDELRMHFKNHPPKGEIVVVIDVSVQENVEMDLIDLENDLKETLQHYSVKDAAELLSQKYKMSKKDIYKIALALKK